MICEFYGRWDGWYEAREKTHKQKNQQTKTHTENPPKHTKTPESQQLCRKQFDVWGKGIYNNPGL